MSYFEIRSLTNCAKKYGNFLNDYEPDEEIREFRSFDKTFGGFSKTPIIFERDKSYKNNEPISDFLLNDWAEIIVSERIFKMLNEKYSNEIQFFECFAKDDGILKPYFILRPKFEIDVLDRNLSDMIDYGVAVSAFKSVLNDNIDAKYNYFAVKDGDSSVISKKLYDDLKALKPTNFEVSTIATSSEELAGREKNRIKAEQKQNQPE